MIIFITKKYYIERKFFKISSNEFYTLFLIFHGYFFYSYNNNLTTILKNILMCVTEEDSLQIADSDYTDNALENLMRAAQQK